MTTLFKASLLLALATLFTKAAAFLKDVQVARIFGTDANLDGFLLVFGFYGTVGNIVGGALAVSAMPQIAAAKAPQVHWALYRSGLNSLIWFSVALALCTVLFRKTVFAVVAPGLISLPGSSMLQLVPVIAPCAVACALTMYMQAFLNLEGMFFRPAVAQVVMPAAQLVALAQGVWPVSIESLAWATCIGYLMQVALLAAITGNAWRRHNLASVFTAADTVNATIRLAPALSVAASSILIGSSDIVIGAFASNFGAGFVSALNFANKYPSLVSSFVLATIITAAYPRLTKHFANGDISHFSRIVGRLGALMFASGLMMLLLFYVFGTDLVKLTFERGSFGTDTTAKVTELQLLVATQLPILLLGMVLTRAASAMHGTASMIAASGFALLAAIAFLNSPLCNEQSFAAVYFVIQFCAVSLLGVTLALKLYMPRLQK